MSYDPSESEERDIIRGRVLDTSDDEDTEYLTDETYDAILARSDDWRVAGAEIALRIYRMIAARPVALGSDGDNIRWSDERAKAILGARQEFLDEIEADADLFGTMSVSQTFLTGNPTGSEDAAWLV